MMPTKDPKLSYIHNIPCEAYFLPLLPTLRLPISCKVSLFCKDIWKVKPNLAKYFYHMVIC